MDEALPRGGTRWRRTAVVAVPALGVAVGLIVATLHGPIPLNLVVSGQDMKLSSNGGPVQVPQGLRLYPSTVEMKNGGETRGVMIAGLPEAVLTKGLCISLVLSFPATGTWTVRLHTSGKTTARQMTLDAAGIQVGEARLTPGKKEPILIGPGAEDLVAAGVFGVSAAGPGTLDGLRADAQGAVISGSVNLRGLTATVNRGRGIANGECW
ncbi:MAG: DUF6230 family protein [Sporichthyaceae bacterium]